MTDRELLELAAKAAGMAFEGHTRSSQGCYIKGAEHPWSPLTDDGDALRLAVKLELILDIRLGMVKVTYLPYKEIYVLSDPDKYSATRHAIVRAAAAIGEAMP